MIGEEVEARARRVLETLAQYASPLDAHTLTQMVNPELPDPQSDSSAVRSGMRAISFLTQAGFIRAQGNGYELTVAGQNVLAGGWEARPRFSWFDQWLETEELVEALDEQRSTAQNGISELAVSNWRQFSSVDIVFHPRLTILTGANGAGKTTLLNVLAPHFNWSAQLLTRGRSKREQTNLQEDVGNLSYTNGSRSPIFELPSSGVGNVALSIPNMQAVPGLFINSHRSISAYQPLASLPPKFSEFDSLQQQFAAEIQTRYSGGSSQYSPLYRMKEALVAAAVFGYDTPAMSATAAAARVWEGFQEVLHRLLPASLEFVRLKVDGAELLLETRAQAFPLEAASGGVSAMLELSWQIYLRQQDQTSFTVCIDEPENHLHPELQRSIVPSLLAGFPDVTFIIATHSPFVVTSMPEAFVYALSRNKNSKISSRKVEEINTTATSDETLMSVLGLDSTLPIWAESRLNELLRELPPSPSADQLRALRDSLRELGLDKQFPAAVRSLGLM